MVNISKILPQVKTMTKIVFVCLFSVGWSQTNKTATKGAANGYIDKVS
jgi:hypothetical protein